ATLGRATILTGLGTRERRPLRHADRLFRLRGLLPRRGRNALVTPLRGGARLPDGVGAPVRALPGGVDAAPGPSKYGGAAVVPAGRTGTPSSTGTVSSVATLNSRPRPARTMAASARSAVWRRSATSRRRSGRSGGAGHTLLPVRLQPFKLRSRFFLSARQGIADPLS